MKTAREIAARVWCDPEMGHVAMDLDAAEEIATILERVRRVQATIHPYQENHGKYAKRDLTPEEAQAAFDAAPEVPLSDERIQEIVTAATASPGPQTHEEARQFHEGFLSGATAYAAAIGHSTLKSDNPKLCDVFDAQGWRTIETFEKLAVVPVVCEHGVKDGDWCEPCNKAMKVAQVEDMPLTLKEDGTFERMDEPEESNG